MKKILLVPSFNFSAKQLIPYMPLGLLYLQAIAAGYKDEIDIFYLQDDLSAKIYSDSEEFAQMFAAQINVEEYDTIGFSTVCNSFHHSLRIAQIIKQQNPKIQVTLGGPHATLLSDNILSEFSEIDAIFMGESENTIRDVLTRRSEGNISLENIPGIKTRQGNYLPPKPTHNIDELPLIHKARDFDKFFGLLPRVTDGEDVLLVERLPIEVSRGCPNRCTFCSTRLFFGEKIRYKSNERIFSEMKALNEKTKGKDFKFVGDNFASYKKNLMGFCEYMIRQNSNFTWTMSMTMNHIKPEDLQTLWDGGCRGFFVGLESASRETLRKINKYVNLEKNVEIIKKAVEMGFNVQTSFIIGFPWETKQEIDKTVELYAKMLEIGVSQSLLWTLCPLPATTMLEQYEIDFDNIKSSIALDDLPINDKFEKIIMSNKELFTQFGYYKNYNLSRLDLVNAIYNASKLHLDYSRKKVNLN